MLTIAVSGRALFHLEREHAIFEKQGVEAFNRYMRAKEKVEMPPGAAFNLVRKLLALNTGRGPRARDRVEVVLLSRNSPDAGMRTMQSILHYELDIDRAVFCQGSNRFRYMKSFGAQLFLSLHEEDVRTAISQGLAAARLLPCLTTVNAESEVRIAVDGDSVLFSDEADDVARTQGIDEFYRSELAKAKLPLGEGPFKEFFSQLAALQRLYALEVSPIRVGLFTSRSLLAHERALRTLRCWGIRLDEVIFSCGLPKGPFLKAFQADMFFDDMLKNIESASAQGVPAGHVSLGTEPLNVGELGRK